MTRDTVLILQHTACETPGRIGTFLAAGGMPLEVVEFEKGQSAPEDPSAFRAIIVLGGPMNVYEEEKYAWLAPETSFIRRAAEGETPLLGVCLGAQLLAKAVGGKVTRGKCLEIGLGEVELTAAGQGDPIFAGFPEKFPVFQWHGDTFSDLNGGELLTRGEACEHQAFRWGRRAYGVQFHLEVTHEMVGEWLTEFSSDIVKGGFNAATLREEFFAREEEYGRRSDQLLRNFFALG